MIEKQEKVFNEQEAIKSMNTLLEKLEKRSEVSNRHKVKFEKFMLCELMSQNKIGVRIS
jgi:hypothetical protein